MSVDRALKLLRKSLLDPDLARALECVRKLPEAHFHGEAQADFGRYRIEIFSLSHAEEKAGVVRTRPHAHLFWTPGWPHKPQEVRVSLTRLHDFYGVARAPTDRTERERYQCPVAAAESFCAHVEDYLLTARLGLASLTSRAMTPRRAVRRPIASSRPIPTCEPPPQKGTQRKNGARPRHKAKREATLNERTRGRAVSNFPRNPPNFPKFSPTRVGQKVGKGVRWQRRCRAGRVPDVCQNEEAKVAHGRF